MNIYPNARWNGENTGCFLHQSDHNCIHDAPLGMCVCAFHAPYFARLLLMEQELCIECCTCMLFFPYCFKDYVFIFLNFLVFKKVCFALIKLVFTVLIYSLIIFYLCTVHSKIYADHTPKYALFIKLGKILKFTLKKY